MTKSLIEQGLELQAASIGESLPLLETDADRLKHHLRQIAAGIACVSTEEDYRLDDPGHDQCRNGRFDEK